MVNLKGKRLTPFDLLSKKHAVQYNLFAKEEENSLAYMIGMLMDAMFLQMESDQIPNPSQRQAQNTPLLIALRKQILKNSLIAAYKYHLKVPSLPFDQQHTFAMCDPEKTFAVSDMSGKWTAIRNLLLMKTTSNSEKEYFLILLSLHFATHHFLLYQYTKLVFDILRVFLSESL
jgi:hypothetical protein